ncbi:hypothetical protein [Methanorbis rubei]|uniref:Uncharacterized protein n=1 Tax=Methanorbis rubei TaxID=3028300 RepID=A0AAE4SAC6_9EURY|nr:hypothetical protein [Methanocorpusculaceae archaeon Cs1]
MRQSSDSGSSVVIGFVILLMVIALGIGIWALISLPAEMKEAESTHTIGLSNAFLDLKLSADKVRVNNFEGARFSMLMPGSSGMSGTTIQFTEDTGGELFLYREEAPTVNLIPSTMNAEVGRLSAQIGGTRGTTVIGYEGGGVFRSDSGNAVWLTPGLLQIYPDATQSNATIRIDLVLINMSGSTETSSNWGVPIDCVYLGSTYDITQSMNDTTLTLSFQSSDPKQQNLWSEMFAEAVARYPAEVAAFEMANPGKAVPEVTLTSEEAKLKISVGGNNWVKVYMRDAAYDVSLVNRYGG